MKQKNAEHEEKTQEDIENINTSAANTDPIEELRRAVIDTLNSQKKQNRSQKRREKKKQEKLAWKLGGERGTANLLIEIGRGRFCFDHSDAQWYLYKDHSWQKDVLQEHFNLLEELKSKLRSERTELAVDPDKNQFILKTVDATLMGLNDLNYCKRILEFATKGPNSLGIKGEEWDKNTHLLAFKNGVVDLGTFEFRYGKPDDFIRNQLQCDWKGFDVKPKHWLEFLATVLPVDPDNTDAEPAYHVISYLQKMFGAAIRGEVREHILPVFIGAGQNGKGTLLEVLKTVLDPLAGPVPPAMIMQQGVSRNSSGPSADLMYLRGKRLVWASETNEGGKLDSGMVKLLTGGDSITARAPYARHQVSFKPSHQLILMTNFSPIVDSDDKALWYRLRLIKFPLSFVENPSMPHERKRDTGLTAKLVAEAPEIIAWIIQGYRKYQLEGLQAPQSVLLDTLKYRTESDILQSFIEEGLLIDESSSISASKLYDAYVKWAVKAGLKPLTQPIFGKKIKEKLGQSQRNSSGKTYKGYKLRRHN